MTSSSTLGGKIDLLSNDVAGLKSQLSGLELAVTSNSDKIIEIENRIPGIEQNCQKQIEALNVRIMELEIHNRRANLLFYGVAEKAEEDVYHVLRDTFKMLGVDDEIPLVNAHRLPRRPGALPEESGAVSNPRPSPPPRAIIARFVYMENRNRVLSAFEKQQRQRHDPTQSANPQTNLAASRPRITVRTDLPPAMKRKRGMLANRAYKLRKENGVSTKIVIVGTNVILKWKEKTATSWSTYKD